VTADLSDTRLCMTTSPTPGAVAILQLIGPGVEQVLSKLTGRGQWEAGRLYLVDFAGIDRGLAVLIRSGQSGVAQLMPHGGPRVVRSLIEAVGALGVLFDPQPDASTIFPEADSPIQADALVAVASASSPAAIDRLLTQPALWRSAVQANIKITPLDRDKIQQESHLLDRLVTPPTVVVVGKPNVGKSTLTNRLMGRSVSLVADLPGTTRDWVGGVVEIADVGVLSADVKRGGGPSSVAVRWVDTPGLRDSADDIEQRAIGLASQAIASAEVLIVMRDPDNDWPDAGDLPREPDIRVVNKADLTEGHWPDAVSISAATGQGIEMLQRCVVDALGLSQINRGACWAFSDTLRRYVRGGITDLSDYLG